jgi:p-hydroxybenzoate 3-monooxygenase
LAPAFSAFYQRGDRAPLDRYSQTALKRVWQVQRFSADMCTLLHRFPNTSEFNWRAQKERLRYMTTNPTGALTYAENFVGLPFEETA